MVGALLLGASARADEHADAIRRDFDALVRRIEQGPQPGADSPTAMFHRLVAADEKRLRAALEEAWGMARPQAAWGAARFFSVRWAIRALHATHGRAVGVFDPPELADDGVLRIRPRDGQGTGCGTCNRQTGPELAHLVGDGSRRTPSNPSADDLVAQLASADLTDNNLERAAELDDFARATGEACARDADARARLFALLGAPRPLLETITAAAWTRDPAAAPPLQRLLVAEAGSPDAESRVGRARLATLCRALVRVDGAALAGAVAKLEPRVQDVVLSAAGLDVAEPFFAAWLDGAAEPAVRASVLHRIARVLSSGASVGEPWMAQILGPALPPPPTGAATTRLLRRLSDAIRHPDADVRAGAAAAATPLLAGRARAVAGGPIPSGLRVIRSSGSAVQPYPDVARDLSALAEDLLAGRLRMTDGWTSVFDAATQQRGDEGPLVDSDVERSLDDALERKLLWGRFPEGTSDLRIRLGGEMVDGGLRIRLTNSGTSAISVNPVAFRHVRAEIVQETVTHAGVPTASSSVLHLIYGSMQRPAMTPATALVVVDPGKSYDWISELRPEDRAVDHVAVALVYRIDVGGVPPAPLVKEFETTWVR